MDKSPITEQLTIWGSVDVWQSAAVKKIRLPEKLTTLRQKLYRCLQVKSTGKPDAGNPHVRFDEGEGVTPSLLYRLCGEYYSLPDGYRFGNIEMHRLIDESRMGYVMGIW